MCNYANVLLVFVPLGIIAGAAKWDSVATFILNFLAIVPLAGLLSFATEELSAKLGQTVGGLLNATFGNAVELIVSIVALREGQIRIVQASMLGSILSNILLVGSLTQAESVADYFEGSRLLLCSKWNPAPRVHVQRNRRIHHVLSNGRRLCIPHHTRHPVRHFGQGARSC